MRSPPPSIQTTHCHEVNLTNDIFCIFVVPILLTTF